jgi:hypothetical protein
MKHFPLSLPQEIELIAQLHLSGSRYFGTAKPASDWDFIVGSASNEAILALFRKHKAYLIGSYAIETGGQVWRWDYEAQQTHIDFQIVPNIAWKLRAQAWIKAMLDEGFCFPDSKVKRNKIWEAAFKASEDHV